MSTRPKNHREQQQDKDILDDYRRRQQLMDLLDLASQYEQGEYGDNRYTFSTATRTAVLDYNLYDGDTHLIVTINGQPEHVVEITLKDCEDIRPIHDEHRRGLEFIGKAPVPGFYRGDFKPNAGLRLYLTPDISVEPFWCFDNGRPKP